MSYFPFDFASTVEAIEVLTKARAAIANEIGVPDSVYSFVNSAIRRLDKEVNEYLRAQR